MDTYNVELILYVSFSLVFPDDKGQYIFA